MRGLRSTIALLVVFGGLFAYIYFVTWRRPADTGVTRDKVFAGVEADKIDELKVTSDTGEVTTLKKESGNWQVVAPVAARADESEASGIATSLAQLEVVRIINESPTELTDYGLATPRIEVDFKVTGDNKPRRLVIGDTSPTGTDLFAKRNDEKEVFLVPGFQETTFNRSTFDLRDKTLLKFERDKVDGVEVNAGGKTLQIAKDGANWKITQPEPVRADYGSVEGVIGRLQTAQVTSIVADDAAAVDLKKYGLDKPAITVGLNMGSAHATLLLGGEAEGNTVYARDASKAMIVTVESALADELKKGADEYRRKDIFEFRAYNATHLEITRSGQTSAFEKVKGPGADPEASAQWRRVSPNAADVDTDKMDGLLSRLSNMRATSFVDSSAKTGLNAPAMTVFVKFEDGKKEERISFGKVDSDVYASLPGEPGAAKFDATDFSEAITTLDELSK